MCQNINYYNVLQNEIFLFPELNFYSALHVFGHTTLLEVYNKFDAVGIDTGCAYGNKLTGVYLGKDYSTPKFIDVKSHKQLSK